MDFDSQRSTVVLIQELSREECLNILAGTRIARLACVHGDQPYIVPVYLTYAAESSGTPSLYGVTTLGNKVEWMRTNPRVCIEVDEITKYDQWASVVVLGRYEELADPSRSEEARHPHLRHPGPSVDAGQEQLSQSSERLEAYRILQSKAMWWEPAETAWSSRPDRKPGESYDPVYYRVCIEQVSGRRALPQTP